ncbi:MAG: hypothetical protein KDD02_07735 [Phaeodactylibacter sp.]|nr:hypothetical protein [Phaeodactylibacter sp.]MCB9299532.1 hypothetical protein [Lewinellaceae bacterium]
MLRYLSCFLLLALASCAEDNSSLAPGQSSNTGLGGSLARFTIVDDFLYTVDNNSLHSFDISNPAQPEPRASIEVGQGVETIFPLNGLLFLGTQSGMLIYQLLPNGAPQFLSSYQHIISCDPVVANTQFAYVTLRVSGCRQAVAGAADLLEIIDISNIQQPTIVASYDLESPYGLGLDGETLFVCLGTSGLKIFNAADPQNLQQLAFLDNINAVDVIPLNGLLLVIGPDRIVQYDYSDLGDIKKISEIAIGV